MTGSAAEAPIRTPDQRLRIFVSSTLKELEPERRAVRAAIEQLRLAPVMFELGARPHPPRELYRAYLGQSDVFVGIYWQQYGWIAPGEEISGLEDEYRLARGDMPKLIYVKQPAEREERLTELMSRIRDDGTASYTPFTTAEDLAELISADLATLLAERFDASRAAAGGSGSGTADRVRRRRRRRASPRHRPDASPPPTRTRWDASSRSPRSSPGWARTRSASSPSSARAGSARAASPSRSRTTPARRSTG